MKKNIEDCMSEGDGKQGIIFIITMQGPDGTDKDRENMKSTFEELNFTIFLQPQSFANSEGIASLIKAARECKYPQHYEYIAVYYSGHGGRDENGTTHVTGSGVDDTYSEKLNINENIIAPLREVEKNLLFFFDCCQTTDSDASSSCSAYRGGSIPITKEKQKPNPGILVAYAASRDQKSFGTLKDGGRWTHCLCVNMKKEINLQEALTRTSDEVRKISAGTQVPVTTECTFEDVVQLKKGKFFFK